MLPMLGAGRGVPTVAGGGGFDPLTTFTNWWDASDTGTITGSPGVTALADQVGTWHLTSDGANAPTTGATTLNGKNVLDFDGTEKLWHPAANGRALPDTFDLFALMRFDATDWVAGSKSLLSINDYADTNPAITLSQSSSLIRINTTGTGNANVNSSSLPATGWHLFRLQGIDNSTIRLWVDGTLLATTTGTYTGFGGATMSLVLGGGAGGTNECLTKLACAGMLDGTLASTTDLHAFLNTEYGLSLP